MAMGAKHEKKQGDHSETFTCEQNEGQDQIKREEPQTLSGAARHGMRDVLRQTFSDGSLVAMSI
jgi:hypothetical protein